MNLFGAILAVTLLPYVHAQDLVDVGGHRLNLYCTGHGSPSVILDAGQADTTLAWRKVQPRVAKFARVCSYDRAGFGFSEGGPLPRDANATVDDLHALLARAKVPAPYVIVGHSIAGLYGLLFASRYRADVAGMVLVDPSFPNQQTVLHAASPTMKRMEAAAPAADAFCYREAARGRLGLEHASQEHAICGFPPTAAANLKAACARGKFRCALERLNVARYARPSFWAAYRSEDLASTDLDSREVLSEQRSFGAMPLTVLTAANDMGDTPLPAAEMRAIDRAWTAGHERLACLSTIGTNVVVPQTGHEIAIARPAVVSAAIAEIVSQTKHR